MPGTGGPPGCHLNRSQRCRTGAQKRDPRLGMDTGSAEELLATAAGSSEDVRVLPAALLDQEERLRSMG